jgi:AcrR family transcriptional regulator
MPPVAARSTTTSAPTSKGASTRDMLLARACEMAAKVGLEGLTIGELASNAGMSKSGVFAHFGSREDLVRQALDWFANDFTEQVMVPAMARPRGMPRLQAIVDNWVRWIDGHRDGCVFLGATVEYDGRPGPMRDHVSALMQRWQQALVRAVALAVETGDLRADTDPELLAFELQSLMLGLHHGRMNQPREAMDLVRRAADRLLARHAATGAIPANA